MGFKVLGHPAVESALTRLPIPLWLRQCEDGTLRISGALSAETEIAIGDYRLLLGPGVVRLWVVFQGGRQSFVSRLHVESGQLRWRDVNRETHGERWSWKDGVAVVDDMPVGRIDGRKGEVVTAICQTLSDVDIELRVVPAEDVHIHTRSGISVNVPTGMVLTAVGHTRGKPDALILSRPMVVGFGGPGVELILSRFRRLSRVLGIRISRLTLHPDGHVEVDGRGVRGMSRAVRRGLHATSEVLSALIREGSSFAMVRPFLVLS